MLLSDIQVNALIAAIASKAMITRAWLLDALTVTSGKDVMYETEGTVKIGDVVDLEPVGPALTQGVIVGVKAANGEFTGYVKSPLGF